MHGGEEAQEPTVSAAAPRPASAQLTDPRRRAAAETAAAAAAEEEGELMPSFI